MFENRAVAFFDFFPSDTIDPSSVRSLVRKTRTKMRNLAYHNATHVLDVMQLAHAVITRGALSEITKSRPDAGIALLLAALLHDVDHCSIPNESLSGAEKSRYGRTSTNERRHMIIARELMDETGILGRLRSETRFMVCDIIDAAILATDVSIDVDFFLDREPRRGDDCHRLTKAAVVRLLKMCDYSHAARGADIHVKWAWLLHAENNPLDGGLYLPPDGFKRSVSRSQSRFIRGVVLPATTAAQEAVSALTGTRCPVLAEIESNVRKNEAMWIACDVERSTPASA